MPAGHSLPALTVCGVLRGAVECPAFPWLIDNCSSWKAPCCAGRWIFALPSPLLQSCASSVLCEDQWTPGLCTVLSSLHYCTCPSGVVPELPGSPLSVRHPPRNAGRSARTDWARRTFQGGSARFCLPVNPGFAVLQGKRCPHLNESISSLNESSSLVCLDKQGCCTGSMHVKVQQHTVCMIHERLMRALFEADLVEDHLKGTQDENARGWKAGVPLLSGQITVCLQLQKEKCMRGKK